LYPDELGYDLKVVPHKRQYVKELFLLNEDLIKRLLDIMISLVVILTVLSWFIPLLFIFIKITSRGPVFFLQKRTGLHNQPFTCVKFRTMVVNSLSDIQSTKRDDKRVTWIGRILRKYSLDELPQFFNVLKGDMSVVGPRPHMLSHTELFSKEERMYLLRHIVKPGITGLSQVKGFRGELQNTLALKQRLRLDLFYLSHKSFMLDLWIMIKTFRLILFGDKHAF
jgi:putative colanic acid biosynthesis UDP-glucose lipid carrier transferase